MNRITTILIVALTAITVTAQQPTSKPLRVVSRAASDVKIYLNPGHGGWGKDDRPLGTIPYPVNSGGTSTSTFPDTCGFYESNTNLWKMLETRDRLIEMGVPAENIKMSRWNNGPYPRDGVTYHSGTNFNRSFSVICAEVNAGNYDYFLSMHSNAATDHTKTNYEVLLYRQTYSSSEGYNEAVPPSKQMAQTMWPYHYMDELDPHTSYLRDNPYIAGDQKFMGTTYSTGYYGVLKHNAPGYILEGFFHTYDPAKHRALNEDYCRQEGARTARGIAAWFSIPDLPTGDIMGTVKDKSQSISNACYVYNTSKGDDMYTPIHGAVVTLYKGENFVAEYCTDDYYNGVFVFEGLTPGSDYYISVKKDGYANIDLSGPYTVTAAQTTYPQLYMTAGTPTNLGVSDLQLSLTKEFTDVAIPVLQDKKVRRVLQRDDYLVVLAVEDNTTHTPHLYRIAPSQAAPNADGDEPLVTEISTAGLVSTSGNCGTQLYDLSDIAFTSDGYLVGCNALKTQSSADQMESGTRGVWRVYKWNSLSGAPTQWFTTSENELSSGHFYRANVGLTMAYNGSSQDGWIMTPAINAYEATSSPQIRDIAMHISGGELSATYSNYDRDASENRPNQSLTAYGNDVLYIASPKADDRFIIDGSLIAPTEKRMNTQDCLAAKELGALPLTNTDLVSNGASTLTVQRHLLLISPHSDDGLTNSGIQIHDITAGLSSAQLVSATNASVDALSWQAIGATGGTSGNKITLHLLRDGKLSRWTATVGTGTIDDPTQDLNLDLELKYSANSITELSGKDVRRAVHLGDGEFAVLAVDNNRTPYLYKVNPDSRTATTISTTGVVDVASENNQGSSLYTLSDIALTSDGKLIAVNMLQTQDTDNDNQIATGYSRGYLRIYRWDDLDGNPVQWFTSPRAGNFYKALVGGSIAYNGSSTNGQLVVSAVNDYYGGSSNTYIRYDVYTISDGNMTDYIFNRQLSSVATKTTDTGDSFKFNASPRGNGYLWLDGTGIAPIEVAINDNNLAATIFDALPVSDLLSNDCHHVTRDSQTLLVSPYSDNTSNLGIRFYDISNGLADAAVVNASNVELDATTPQYTAVFAHTTADNALVAYLVRDNVFAKWSTAGDEPAYVPTDEGIGIFAYNLRLAQDENDNYTFSFDVNTSPLTATIIFSDDNVTELGRYSVPNPMKGANSVAIAQEDLPFAEGATAHWSVNVTGYPVTETKKLNTGSGFNSNEFDYTRASVTVDNSPESDYFGSVYVNDLKTRNSSSTNAANRDNGIYRYNPLWQRENSSPYTGNMAWDNNFRITTDYLGRLYVPDYGDNHGGVFLAYPDRMTDTWQCFFAGERTASTGLITYNGINTGCSSPAVNICGTGDGTKLYASLEDFSYNVYCYDLGANMTDGNLPAKWFTEPVMVHEKTKLQYSNNNLIAQPDGAVWIAENLVTTAGSQTNIASHPALRYITPRHDDYWSYATNSNTPVTNLNGCAGGGFAISNDGSWLVIVDGDGVLQFFDIDDSNRDKPLLTWNHSYNADAKDSECTAVAGGRVPNGVYQIAFDYGGNMYVAGGALGIYSIPNADNQTTTPAKNALTVTRLRTRTLAQLVNEPQPLTNIRLQDPDLTVAYVLADNSTVIARSTGNGIVDDGQEAVYHADDYISQMTDLTDGQQPIEANWVAITLPGELSDAQIEGILGKRLGNVHGSLTDVLNPTIVADALPSTIATDSETTLNVYLPTNFGDDFTTSVGEQYYFASPQPCEVANIYWAMWDGTQFVIAPQGANTAIGTANPDGLTGEFNVDMSLYGDPDFTLESNAVYNGFTALIRKQANNGANSTRRKSSGTQTYVVYPLEGLTPQDIITDKTDLTTDAAVVKVETFDLTGRPVNSDASGVVIEVTTYDNGTTSSRKYIRK